MTIRLIAVIATLGLVGCKPTSPAPLASEASVARFEIRDFKLDPKTSEYGSLSVDGRGTLVALDDSLRKGTFLVWLTVKRAHKSDEPVDVVLLLRDGLATIETSDYVAKEDKDKVKVKYIDWKVAGYVPFREGVLVSERVAPASSN